MPNYTANFALPYPNPTDDPCLFAEQWCDFAAAVNAVLDGFQETIDRTVPVVPMAQMRITTAQAYNSSLETFVTFDAVSFDTAGWTDFDANPRAISTDRAAVFNVHASDITDPDGVNSLWTIRFEETDLSGITTVGEAQQILDRGGTGTRIGNTVTNLVQRNQPIDTYLEVFVNGSVTYNLTNAYMTIWWHADTVRAA